MILFTGQDTYFKNRGGFLRPRDSIIQSFADNSQVNFN